MADILSSLLGFIHSEQPVVRILVALAFLIAGHLTVKIFRMLTRRTWMHRTEEATKKDIERREEKLGLVSNILDGGIITTAIIYLNSGISTDIISKVSESSPRIVSALLVGFLGIILIRIVTKVFEGFLTTVGVNNYLRDIGLSRSASNVLSAAVKILMYIVLFQVVLNQLNVGYTYLNELLTAATWAFAFMMAGIVFYSLKDLFQNMAAGFYLKNSRLVRKGEEVKVEGDTGEIKEVSLFSTSVNTDSGYTLLTPNTQLMDSPLRIKRTQSDLETLEDITSYFVAQNPSYCGPASAEMALEIFGYRHDQEEIGEKADVEEGEGVDEDDLMDAIEELTNNEVRTAWIGYDNITDLEDEYKSWFNDGALIVSNFYKPEIFPDASAGHFVLSVGVEGDEILNLDPSGTNGGVYYVNKETFYDAMAEFGHKRGYIVVAPKGTTAYWRIKNDLIYGDKSLYDELSKTLESRLRKIMRKGRILKNSTPESMEKYMEDWTSEEKLTRVWKPEGFSGEKEKLEGDEDETTEDN
ncbi:MAG: mechanosensitive ion channel domain-containing protein [Candidatus Nanohalobium sp.]